MLERLGQTTRGLDMRTRNVAAVIVTAELPAFAVGGNRIDITVSSLSDATSLAGGTLVMTPLQGPNSKIYAVAQGSVVISGFQAKGQNETLTHGVPTAGRIVGGALVERDAPDLLADSRTVHLELKNPDFVTAIAIVDAINDYTRADRQAPPGARKRADVARDRGAEGHEPGALPRRDRPAQSRARHAGAHHHRRTHRHDRHQPQCQGEPGRGHAWQPDGARRRDAGGVATGAVFEGHRRS